MIAEADPTPEELEALHGAFVPTMVRINAEGGYARRRALFNDLPRRALPLPDGKRLASASWDKTVRLWDAESGQPVGAPLTGHEGSVNSVAFSPDGQRLVSASEDKTVRLWDPESGQPLGPPLMGHDNIVWSVAFSPDGKRLASASEDPG